MEIGAGLRNIANKSIPISFRDASTKDFDESLLFIDGQIVNKDFVVTQSPRHFDSAPRHKSEILGMTVRDLTFEVRRHLLMKPDDPGVVISKIEPGENPSQAVRREIREEVGVEVTPEDQPLVTVKHAYSHFRITMQAFVCRHVRGRARPIRCAAVKWVPIDNLDQYAVPRANQKVLAKVREHFA